MDLSDATRELLVDAQSRHASGHDDPETKVQMALAEAKRNGKTIHVGDGPGIDVSDPFQLVVQELTDGRFGYRIIQACGESADLVGRCVVLKHGAERVEIGNVADFKYVIDAHDIAAWYTDASPEPGA